LIFLQPFDNIALNNHMPKSHILLVLVLLVVLAVVFFAPSMHLEPTALRAARDAAMVFLAIFIAAHLFVSALGLAAPWDHSFFAREASSPGLSAQSSLIDLYCARLC
jgi:quinol-cytochrome oxidoreductase complex cytochrome b subunit